MNKKILKRQHLFNSREEKWFQFFKAVLVCGSSKGNLEGCSFLFRKPVEVKVFSVKGFKRQTIPEEPRSQGNVERVAGDCRTVGFEGEVGTSHVHFPMGLQGEKSPPESWFTLRCSNRKSVFKVGCDLLGNDLGD